MIERVQTSGGLSSRIKGMECTIDELLENYKNVIEELKQQLAEAKDRLDNIES